MRNSSWVVQALESLVGATAFYMRERTLVEAMDYLDDEGLLTNSQLEVFGKAIRARIPMNELSSRLEKSDLDGN